MNRVRAALVESNGAFERLVDLDQAWTPDVPEGTGGPWQILDAGRDRLSEVARGARDCKLDAPWESLSRATRPTEEQVRSEAATFRILARRIRSLRADADELSGLVVGEAEGDETHRCLPAVPGMGPATAAQLVAGVGFPGNDKLAGHCGHAPKDTRPEATSNSASSSPEGNRCLKNLLIFACLSLVRSGGEFGRRCRACRARGMRRTAALKTIARKRLKVIYAVMGDRRPYAPPA